MSDINTVCISTQEYKQLLCDSFELEQAQNAENNLVNYIERLEEVVIAYIKKETHYGEYSWKLKEEFRDIISVLNAESYDWSKGKAEDDETEPLFEEADEGYQE